MPGGTHSNNSSQPRHELLCTTNSSGKGPNDQVPLCHVCRLLARLGQLGQQVVPNRGLLLLLLQQAPSQLRLQHQQPPDAARLSTQTQPPPPPQFFLRTAILVWLSRLLPTMLYHLRQHTLTSIAVSSLPRVSRSPASSSLFLASCLLYSASAAADDTSS